MTPDQALDLVRRRARVKVHSGALGCEDQVMDEGRAAAFLPHPSLIIEHDDGTRAAWMVTLPVEEITAPWTWLSGDYDCNVSLMCRECSDGGKPIAWYGPHQAPNPYDDVPTAHTIAELARVAEEHDRTHQEAA